VGPYPCFSCNRNYLSLIVKKLGLLPLQVWTLLFYLLHHKSPTPVAHWELVDIMVVAGGTPELI
jgi:hypothetical protein